MLIVRATALVPVRLHVCQPQKQIYEPPARAMKLGYDSFPLAYAGYRILGT